ncbi:MAG: YegS/Rv2252/BmrU family lipid kinase [Chlorobiaceae bacterium]|jgi:diacylglycerol kinase (ATP)|nr:YegS/Rv2252/BmrU family lipid kinase [Chlorobiaceae bacterium]NTW62747.1 YegS/Rv2252/BmrU family lipid kinase [Chlorobiaceae bacterium]
MPKRLFYTFILNPAADKGRAACRAGWLKGLVSQRDDAVVMTTAFSGHAEEIARSANTENACLVACGGDGTLHEIVNAVAGTDVAVGIVPIGSANDFLKTFEPHRGVKQEPSFLFGSTTRLVDLGGVSIESGLTRYFVNSLGVGLTGRIARVVKKNRWLKGEPMYVHALLRVLVGYKPLKMHIKITRDDAIIEINEPVFAFSISNGKVEGGKFLIAPDALLADGLLDICILKSIPKLEFFRYVFKYIRGTHISDSKVVYCQASAVEIFLSDPEVMHLDGEVFEGVQGCIRVAVRPLALRVLMDASGHNVE